MRCHSSRNSASCVRMASRAPLTSPGLHHAHIEIGKVPGVPGEGLRQTRTLLDVPANAADDGAELTVLDEFSGDEETPVERKPGTRQHRHLLGEVHQHPPPSEEGRLQAESGLFLPSRLLGDADGIEMQVPQPGRHGTGVLRLHAPFDGLPRSVGGPVGKGDHEKVLTPPR